MQNHADTDDVGTPDTPATSATADPPDRPVAPDAADPPDPAPGTPGFGTPEASEPDPTAPDPAPAPAGTDGFFGAVRRIGIPRTDDRWIGGVCAGLAHRFGLDPLLMRGIVAATVLVGGFGFVLYAVGWALLPEARDGRIHLQETLAGRFDAALLGALGIALLGLVRGDGWMWWGRGPAAFQAMAWMVFVGVVIAAVVIAVTSRGNSPAAPTTRPAAHPGPAGHGAPGYNGPPTPPGPPPGFAAPAPWTPPLRPVTFGPGRTAVGIVVALTLLAAAGLLFASRTGHLDAQVLLVAAGVGVVLAGLGIVASGLRGRRSGVLGFLAIITLVVAGPWAVVEAADWSYSDSPNVLVFTDVHSAEAGVDQGAGSVIVDLRGLAREPAPPAPPPDEADPPDDADPTDVPEAPTAPEAPVVPNPQTIDVPLNLGVGGMTIYLPDNTRATVEVEVGAGRVTWDVGLGEALRGVSVRHTFHADGDPEGPELVIRVTIGAGNLTISRPGGL
ncbi:MAG: PspC domain-containing protein [Micrococcales bacterium]|nr:PspC domain-containing protein [Micrococcales bacterium]